MPDSLAVTYATRYGSTKEVAEAIVATLREHGIAVHVEPAREVRSLEGYSAVVLGVWLQPVEIEVFGGAFDPAKLSFPLNRFAGAAPASDIRDWTAVRSWADRLTTKLEP